MKFEINCPYAHSRDICTNCGNHNHLCPRQGEINLTAPEIPGTVEELEKRLSDLKRARTIMTEEQTPYMTHAQFHEAAQLDTEIEKYERNIAFHHRSRLIEHDEAGIMNKQ